VDEGVKEGEVVIVSTGWHRDAMRALWFAILIGALVASALAASAASPTAAHAQVEEGRYSVLVFSRTTGFRHTEAIDAGKAALQQMAEQEDFDVTLSEQAGDFTDHNLRGYDVIVFLNTDGEGILNAAQRTAFERWMQRGGGLVAIHADANADRDWAWKTEMRGGALFDNHPSGALQFQAADVVVEDATHPATAALPPVWNRVDEWYNFTEEPRGKVHVLLTLDEATYEEQDGSAEADDHPIAWCSVYDGGRSFYTALGHESAQSPAWSQPLYRAHILGALEWAAGEEPGDCGAERPGLPTEASLTKVTLDDETANPMSLSVAPDGRVFFVQMGSTMATSGPAQVKLYDPEADATSVIATLNVLRRNENGLMGIALDPNFADNKFVYLYYSAPGGTFVDMGTQRLSRFTFDEATDSLDMSSEVIVLTVPHQRLVCCHAAGSLGFGPDGNLYLSTGDDTEHSQSNGYSPHDSRQCGSGSWDAGDADCNVNPANGQPAPWPTDALHANDARRTSGNTNDLRGKIVRIDPIETAQPGAAPGVGSTYQIPDGNLFPESEDTEDKTRPEIYTMGHRNPFRFGFDPETGWIYQGEVGPDSNTDNLQPPPSAPPPNNEGRGPRGYDEINQIRAAGNYGWPYCIGNNFAYRPWAFTGATGAAGGPQGGENAPYFDCAGGPTNNSPVNTGLAQVPPGRPAWIYYPYGSSPQFPEIPAANSRAAVGGPVYRYDAELESDVKLSEWFDGRLIWGDWTRNLMMTTKVGDAGEYEGSTRLMPSTSFAHPHDIELGPDGAIYMIEWGNNFNYGSYGINADSGLYRIEQRTGGLPALATAHATPTFGSAPLEVRFTGELSDRGADEPPTYAWDFGDGTTSTDVNPSHTYMEPGTYEVTLTVIDAAGETTDTVTITVRNQTECGAPRSDQFAGDALDDDRWDVVRRDDTRLSVSNGALNLVSAPQDIFQGETGLPNIVLQDLPEGGAAPWSITTEVTWDPTQNYQNAGLIVYQDDDNYIKTGMVWSGGRAFELIKETNGTASFDGNAPAGTVPSRFFLRYVSTDGTSLQSAFSADGVDWTTIGTTDLEGIENPRVGVYATASTQAGVGQPTAAFHSVAIDPERAECSCLTDEFDGTELDGKWTPLRWDEDRDDPVVDGGNLVFPLGKFGFDRLRPGPATILGQPIPDGDWSVTAKISAPGLNTDTGNAGSNFAKVGLIVLQENTTAGEESKHWISYQHTRNADGGGTTNTYFESTAQNGLTGGANGDGWTLGDRVGDAPAETNLPTFWLRITRTGNAIEGFYAIEDPEQGGLWTSLNVGNTSSLDIETFMPAAEGPIYVGAYGANGSIDTFFDYIRFEPDVPCEEPIRDTTPPETTHTLEGEGPVEVTLSATDPGEGGGEPQTHDVDANAAVWDPDSLTVTSGDVVRWNFPEETAQFPHDVWVIEPGEAPDSAGTEATDGIVSPGGPSVSLALHEPGTWTFVCKVHSSASSGRWEGMVGTAEVEPGEGPSGVDFTEYRITKDGGTGDWVQSRNTDGDDPFETAFTVSEEGEYEVEYRSTDHADNAEATNSVAFEIEAEPDTTPPVTTVQLNGAAPVASYTGAVTATFGATDDASGVARTEYKIDSAADWTSYDPANPPQVAGAGAHTIQFRSADVAGNVETTRSVTFNIVNPPSGGQQPPPPPPRPSPPPQPPAGGGTTPDGPVLRASVRKKRLTVSRNKKRISIRFRMANSGDAMASSVRVCATVPKRRMAVVGKRCRTVSDLAAGDTVVRTFRLRLKPAARGKRTKVRFTASGPGVQRRTVTVTVRVRK
jgi:glucose/arabinose dehydrogenase/PKD repeat protein